MKKALLIFLLISSLFLSAGCGSGFIGDQLRFGIWASENDLWDEAIFRWKRVLEENPRSVSAHNNLAVAYEKKGFWEEARKEYETALKLAPENTYVKYNFDQFKASRDQANKDLEDKEKSREIKGKESEKGGHGR